MHFDDHGLPVNVSGDGGDSMVRAAIIKMTNHRMAHSFALASYFQGSEPVRYPIQEPWNNPKNFSRDQLIMLCGAMKRLGVMSGLMRSLFYSCLKRLCFAPNTERDYPGTTKYPWPHKVYPLGKPSEIRLFDFPDPLLPNHMGALIITGKVYEFYWFLPLAYVFHLLALFSHRFSGHHEENQMIAECYVYGTLPIYRRWHKRWKDISKLYWSKRNEVEYHEALERFIGEL